MDSEKRKMKRVSYTTFFGNKDLVQVFLRCLKASCGKREGVSYHGVLKLLVRVNQLFRRAFLLEFYKHSEVDVYTHRRSFEKLPIFAEGMRLDQMVWNSSLEWVSEMFKRVTLRSRFDYFISNDGLYEIIYWAKAKRIVLDGIGHELDTVMKRVAGNTLRVTSISFVHHVVLNDIYGSGCNYKIRPDRVPNHVTFLELSLIDEEYDSDDETWFNRRFERRWTPFSNMLTHCTPEFFSRCRVVIHDPSCTWDSTTHAESFFKEQKETK